MRNSSKHFMMEYVNWEITPNSIKYCSSVADMYTFSHMHTSGWSHTLRKKNSCIESSLMLHVLD
jgi:hypothetical protein